MSMTSSQYDELRDWACELRKLANGPVNEGFPAREKLFESADAMCQAADTILELREMAQKANAENVKLRNLIELMRSCPGDKGECDECRRLNDGCEVERLSRDHGIEAGE